MWIFTKDGFYSVAQDAYCNEEQVTARARVRLDLERLQAWCKKNGLDKGQNILKIDHADYRYRVIMPKDTWAKYAFTMAAEIDYPTVKDNIVPSNESVRKNAYYGVWNELYSWQDLAEQRS